MAGIAIGSYVPVEAVADVLQCCISGAESLLADIVADSHIKASESEKSPERAVGHRKSGSGSMGAQT